MVKLWLWTMVELLLASRLGLVGVLKSVYGSQLAQPHCHLGFVHAIVYGEATTAKKNWHPSANEYE